MLLAVLVRRISTIECATVSIGKTSLNGSRSMVALLNRMAE
jgi:hypothetical protein